MNKTDAADRTAVMNGRHWLTGMGTIAAVF
jgi:hypothetical protein